MTELIHDIGLRRGSTNIHGIRINHPTQALTSTNLKQIAAALESQELSDETKQALRKLVFGTKIVEIIEFSPRELVSDSKYYRSRVQTVSNMIAQHPQYLFLFTLQNVKSGTVFFTTKNNKILIEFQKECGFKLIKAFFQNRNVADHALYRELVYKDLAHKRFVHRDFVACLDENMHDAKFKSIYEACLKKGDRIISFLGRKPAVGTKNIANQKNFLFLRSHRDDKIIRITSSIEKVLKSPMVSSLAYYWYGLDVTSFTTRINLNYKGCVNALNYINYETLCVDTQLLCVITNKNLYRAREDFSHIISIDNEFSGLSIPVFLHDIVRLNQLFSTFHEQYTESKLKQDLGDRVSYNIRTD